ncbi:MAG: HAD family hydrolase [Lachnospiraceae bacterium]|nr:HAD family hydrolase [Lachnospiraceae bacterium]
MIKLIATDIDGTLVKDSSASLYPELLETVEALVNQGMIFFAASGRQYYSIRNMFDSVADKIGYIAENGAHIRLGDKDLQVVAMEREHVVAIINQLRQYSDTCDMIISTTEGSLVESKNQDFLDLITYGYHNKFTQVEDVLAGNAPIIKIAIYRKGSIRDLGESVLIPAWKDKVKACMAGEEWVDFMDASVDKGNALTFIQQYFDVTKEETMAFGDNGNDIGLMKAAGESYAVENAVEEVKEAAKHICPDYTKQGVCQVLKTVLQKKEDEWRN